MCVYGKLCKYRQGSYTETICNFACMTGTSKVAIRRSEGRKAPPNGWCEFFEPKERMTEREKKRLRYIKNEIEKQKEHINMLLDAVEDIGDEQIHKQIS